MPVEKQRKRGIKPSPLHLRLLSIDVGQTHLEDWQSDVDRRVQAARLRSVRTYIQDHHGVRLVTRAREAGIEVRRLR